MQKKVTRNLPADDHFHKIKENELLDSILIAQHFLKIIIYSVL
jgi:hypothetical protein